MPGLSVIIPHLSRPFTDASLELCLKTLRENTINRELQIIVVEGKHEPYEIWNRMSEVATYDHLVLTSDDMIVAPEWDVSMQAAIGANPRTMVTMVLVEPGVVDVTGVNMKADFGLTPQTFRRADFERFAKAHRWPTQFRSGTGWYQPVLFPRALFRELGKYPCQKPFPHPNDVALWETARRASVQMMQACSFAYHFQNLSNPDHDRKREPSK